MRARYPGVVLSAAITVTFAVVLAIVVPSSVAAQRRPGMAMGFYTTTGLLSGDVEVGPVTSSTSMAEAPSLALSLLLTAPLKRAPKRAWIVGLRATALGIGNSDSCYIVPGSAECQNRRFEERVALLTGGAFDIRSSVLRAMIGPALYSVEGQGSRFGTSLRVDLASPRLRGPTPTLFFTRTLLGSQRGESVAIGTLGASFRWVRKR